MIYWLFELREWLAVNDILGGSEGWLYKVLNLFKYHTLRAGGAALTSVLLSLFFGEWMIRKLISLKIGQPIRTAEEVHKLFELHGKKAGTPTMGGLLILVSIVVSTLVWARWSNGLVWIVMLSTVGLGALGFYDDYLKISKKNSKGVSAKLKLTWQGVVALAVALLLCYGLPADQTGVVTGDAGLTLRALWLPFMKEPLIYDMGFFAVIFFSLIIVGASNAVNFTDGLDGLASGCSLTTALTYALLSYICGNVKYSGYLAVPHFDLANELPIIAMALSGSCVGFLWFNAHPARVFMGDTGSLALGGCIAALAIGCKQEIILGLVGGVFVMEACSVMIQVASFKLRGKRVFKMAPIHHHFELLGWHENQVIVRFWILSILFALMGLATLKLR